MVQEIIRHGIKIYTVSVISYLMGIYNNIELKVLTRL